MTTPEFAPTPEQQHILDLAKATRDNIMINALAGCGKTSTLELIEACQPDRPVLYMAFNKKIAVDAEKRMASTTTVRTFNSLGHRIWAQSCAKKIALDPKKISLMLREYIKEQSRPIQSRLWDEFWLITSGINTARAFGYIPPDSAMASQSLITRENFHEELEETPDRWLANMIDLLLLQSIRQAYNGYIDFNDQAYMPTLFGGKFPEFPLVMVDEFQDLSPINHAMIRKLVKHRIIGVGDPNQNIYGFRGAMAGGMEQAINRYSMIECPLSQSFRCPEAIVRSVHWHVPTFRWTKIGGNVRTLLELHIDSIPDEATFICRNNAPLFRVAMKMLSNGRSVSVSGSDIGPKVLAQMKKLGPETLDRASFLVAIDEWVDAKLAKGSKTAEDTADCMRVFANQGINLSQAMAYAEHLFAQKGSITFTTGHKAKGLEWPTVYHLDPWLCADTTADNNLRYVISTRAQEHLYEVNSKNIIYDGAP